MKEILEKVLAHYNEEGVEGHIEEVNGADTLRLIPTGFGDDKDSTVVMEICKVPMDDDDCSYIQFYTTIVINLEEKDYPDILLKLNDINLSTLMGYYGILAEAGMIYHKTITRLPTMSDDDLAKNIIAIAYDCFSIIDYNFQALMDIFS